MTRGEIEPTNAHPGSRGSGELSKALRIWKFRVNHARLNHAAGYASSLTRATDRHDAGESAVRLAPKGGTRSSTDEKS